MNLKNNDDSYFQYAVTVTLKYKINQTAPPPPKKKKKNTYFIDQYDWRKISFTSRKKHYEKVEVNNKKLILMCCRYHTIVKK